MLWDSTCFSTFIHLSKIWQEADDDETGTIDESQHWHRHCSLMFIWFFCSLGVNCNSNPICRPLYLPSGDGWRMLFCFLLSHVCCFYMLLQTSFRSSSEILPGSGHSLNSQRLASKSSTLTKPATSSKHFISSVWTAITCNMCNMCDTHSKLIQDIIYQHPWVWRDVWLHWNDLRCIHSWKSMVSLCHGPKTKMLDLEGNKTTESLQATANWFCNSLGVFEFAISSKMILFLNFVWSERKRSNLNMLFKSMDADGQGSEFFEVLRVVHASIGFVARNAHFWWTLWWCSWQDSECRVARCCRKSSTDCVFFCFETAYWRLKGPPYVWNLKIISTYFDYIILDFAG